MSLSRFFSNLASAYDAEINDLVSDSEGKNVLAKRLADKRSQVGFLVHMMEENPEMLAAAFHQGFGYPSPAFMENLVTLEPAAFPAWSKVASAITLTPWAQTLAATVLKEPTGAQFMTVAAGLEYLYQRTDPRAQARAADDGEDTERDEDEEELQEAHDLEEAGGEWLVEQGFDPKPARS